MAAVIEGEGKIKQEWVVIGGISFGDSEVPGEADFPFVIAPDVDRYARHCPAPVLRDW